MKGNARIGRSLWGTSPSSNVRHPTALWDQGKAASIRACRRTRSDLTGENISTKNIPLRCGEKELSSPPPPSFLFFLFRALSLSHSLSGASSFSPHLHFDFSPHSSRGACWNIKPPCMTICTCMDLKTQRW